ncbi:hypothetical protein [Peterkaempfera griseoplana]|uniref:hypothetical protein n=1 Tax=Peterkaempfera griseoplana TaxID=66896 RepID=UPI0006E3E0DB|nr:hypothetical protein [Peterkaempfera griseoplana]
MTYDIGFLHVAPGRTFAEALEERNSGWNADTWDPRHPVPPMRPTPDQRRQWERTVRRVAAAFGPVEVEEFPSTWTLHRHGPEGSLQLDCDGNGAEIEIPYRYPGEAALPIVVVAYRIARIVEEETGMTGFDFEADQPVSGGDVRIAAARLGGVAQWVRDNLV